MAVPEGQDLKPGFWQVGAWVAVEGTNPTSSYLIKPDGEDLFPDESCMSRDVPRQKPHLVNR